MSLRRVEQRPQVRVDLGDDVAGQEAEPLAGLDRRADQDDLLDRALAQQADRHADGEIGLAGAGGADARGRGRCRAWPGRSGPGRRCAGGRGDCWRGRSALVCVPPPRLVLLQDGQHRANVLGGQGCWRWIICRPIHPNSTRWRTSGTTCVPTNSMLVWDSYEAIVAACKAAWDFLISDPDRIRSVGSRDWACVNT